jgi:hypothetical protein
MKKWAAIVIVFLSVLHPSPASENEEIAFQARQDALLDEEASHAFGIGLLTFGLCFAATPLSSIIITFACYASEVRIPETRLSAAMERYPDTADFLIYTTLYRETRTPIQRRKKGTAALVGTGLGLSVYVAIGIYLFSTLVVVG